ncbi:MAG: GNAT family N-acetyltransferase [Syntrophomonas sp.]|nr:GNAT family N-acetyltransferase [Syntrophomonas sp.]
MGNQDFIIRNMTKNDLALAIELAAQEGWNPGINDADSFWATDRYGFLIGEINGEPVGCISSVSYGGNFGFLGLYIVKPEFRGQGYGMKLWNCAIERLGNITIGLDGVVAQQENYTKSGFVMAYNNARYEGVAQGKVSEKIIPLAQVPLGTLLEYDQKLFGAPRAAFLKEWINQPGTYTACLMNGDQILGFGVARPCRLGYKIGPLFADNLDIAQDIFAHLAASISGQTIYLDIPEINPDALQLVKKQGMQKVFATARMYKGKAPVLPVDHIFGVTTFELG